MSIISGYTAAHSIAQHLVNTKIYQPICCVCATVENAALLGDSAKLFSLTDVR